jgi:predicted alpha-1,2-mannosidase
MRYAGVLLPALLALSCAYGQNGTAMQQQPVDYVNPNIGGIGLLLTSTEPLVQYPFGMARVAPETTPGMGDRYLATRIFGFPTGPVTLMASTGSADTHAKTYASEYDHALETATPYYYEAQLQSWGINAEYTVTQDAEIYRFTFPASEHAHLVLRARQDAQLAVDGSTVVQGSRRVYGAYGQNGVPPSSNEVTREYFYAVFSQPMTSWQTWQGTQLSDGAKQAGASVGYVGSLSTTAGETVEVRVGISYISVAQAKRNLEEQIPEWNFDRVKQEGREVWNNALGKIALTGGTQKQRTIFYTALYRSLQRMTNITEDGRYYSGYDHRVHEADGHDFYVDDGAWDTFRSMHPLQLLLNGKQQEDMIRSYLRMYAQSGWMPSFPSVSGPKAVMIGHHSDEIILDAYEKGYRDFNVEEAYAAMKKNALDASMLPWTFEPMTRLGREYLQKGFFPALAYGEKETVPQVTGELRQAVSVTLENAYDDWCVATLAKALGKTADAKYFMKLANNYKNVFNPAIGFMAPRSADGKWVTHYDPRLGGGQGARDYFTEMDGWVYTFSVQYDVAGLIHLMGGRDKFNAKLDQLFEEPLGTSKFRFLNQFPDATGLIGLYAQGNEPSFHIMYLYDFSGQPWKTQRRVRQAMSVWYTDGPRGIPGDDDGGETSSWYVLSALGFYPVCPGSPVFEIGSPIFAKSVIRMGNGKDFTIVADHVSARNKYIQSATLNGQPLNRPWFSQSQIANGATLVLEMGDEPNRAWGSAPEDAPPSMSASAGAPNGK